MRWLARGSMAVWLATAAYPVAAAELDDAEKLLATGRYEESLGAARAALGGGAGMDWRVLLVRGLVATGQREQAAREAEALTDRHPTRLLAWKLAHETLRDVGQADRAAIALQRLRQLASAAGASIDDPEDLVAAGQAALLAGDEPRAVLSAYFEEALKRDPACKAAYLAAGQLGLDKHDDRLAAEWFQRGLGKLGADADLYAGLARAHYEGDRKQMTAALDAALHLNGRHRGALLLRAEHEIDGEDYPAAGRSLEKVLAVDGRQPTAWAFQAVLAHLRNDRTGEERARQRALAVRASNPEVDALIGRKLSQKYRFAQGAAYQRRALAADPAYLPARAQLAQDLLRLGQDREGWALAEEVHARDGYDVAMFNLATLHDRLRKFTAVARKGFVLRMEPGEARIYGDEAASLLDEASRTVDRKYGFQRRGTVAVEIFPEQSDFAVRTFGMPGGAGYLGVCFGSLITMNSPAGTGAAPVSWRSVLWHEYTHVVTLGLTGNRIPRWLSEGISVHEELAHDPNWGQRMTPRYRQMIQQGELSPVGKLSAAFLAPKTPEHLVFAYYQSALVVEFLVERFGLPALRAVLDDLGRGVDINQALAARTAPLPQLEKEFAGFARKRAEGVAPGADFADPDPAALADGSGQALDRFLARRPQNVPALMERAQQHIDKGAWQPARALLEKAVALAPEPAGADSPHLLLAGVYRKLGLAAEERKLLERLAATSSDAVAVYRRLLEIAEARGDVEGQGKNAERLLAVNPMLEAGWRGRGRALEAAAGRDRAAGAAAVAAYERLLLLDPADQADTRLRLARLLKDRDRRAARRHLLEALAEAPRLRAGHQLLLELAGEARAPAEGPR
jgi:Tfp pilus assembly protein PilF